MRLGFAESLLLITAVVVTDLAAEGAFSFVGLRSGRETIAETSSFI
jgi:hypothetical protein